MKGKDYYSLTIKKDLVGSDEYNDRYYIKS